MLSLAIELESVTKRFGGLTALDNLSLHIKTGEFVTLIGPNGAGKTTLLNVVSGVFRQDSGKVLVFGEEFRRPTPEEAARRGVARTFQLVQLFDSMTVAENVALPLMIRGWRVPAAIARACEYLKRVGIFDQRNAKPSELPFAIRRRAELARALALEPRLLLADEVMAGLERIEVEELVELLENLVSEGVTVVAVEHNLDVLMARCPRIVVLNQGRVIADGTPSAVASNPSVVESYLGRRVRR